MVIATTERLILRRWQHVNREPFSRMNADPLVMEFMPSLLSPAESDTLVDHIEAHFRERGFGLCAVELRSESLLCWFCRSGSSSVSGNLHPMRRNWMATFA
jgi:RimJ/RimL family protein N-acetyltransferase